MPERDATLDAFIPSSDTEADAEADAAEDEADDAGDDAVATVSDRLDPEAGGDPDDVAVSADENEAEASESDRSMEAAVTTMAWSPDGAACEACGDTAMRRWRTDFGFVCQTCVDWERTPNQ